MAFFHFGYLDIIPKGNDFFEIFYFSSPEFIFSTLFTYITEE